jgi:hypothetical protein
MSHVAKRSAFPSSQAGSCDEARSNKGKSACVVYLPDLENNNGSDLPPSLVKLRLIKKRVCSCEVVLYIRAALIVISSNDDAVAGKYNDNKSPRQKDMLLGMAIGS